LQQSVELSLRLTRKGLVDELVDQAHHPEFPSVIGPVSGRFSA
jgi:hypothetical protein